MKLIVFSLCTYYTFNVYANISSHLILLFSVSVLLVGLSPLSVGVGENDQEVFVCVSVFSGGPVLSDRRVRIGTEDGTAVGMLLSRIIH